MTIEKYSKKAPSEKPLERNYAGNLIIIGLVIATIALISYAAYWVSPGLAKFMTTQMELNDYYAGAFLGFIFLITSVILFAVVMFIDGDQKRLQGPIYHYTSKLVAKDYYAEGDPVAAAERAAADPNAQDGSFRASASVRPKAAVVEEDYKSGKIDGAFKEFYPDGRVKREIRYIKGKRNGLYRTFYANGQTEQEGYYREDNLDGLYRSYYESGALHQQKEYRDGKLNGVYKAIDEQGVLYFEITYKNGKQHGEDKIYDQRGVLQYLDTYVNGLRVNRKTYNEYGVLTYDQDFEEAIEEVERIAAEEEKIRDRETQEREKRQQSKG